MSFQSRFIDVGGCRIHYLEAGSGVPLVLLHGTGVDSARLSWDHFLERLSSVAHVIAPDFPGNGESDRPDIGYTLDDLITFVSVFLDALGVETVHLAGFSMGGATAIGWALSHPDRVRSLILIDSYGLQDRVILHRAGYMLFRHPMLNKLNYQLMARSLLAVRLGLRGVFYSTRNMSDAFISTALAEVRRPNPGRAYDRFQRDELRWRGVRSCYYRRLHELTMPVQMIHGAKDLTVPVKWAERAVHAFPNATLSIIPKCGHMSHRDQPEQVLEPMMTFLKLRLR